MSKFTEKLPSTVLPSDKPVFVFTGNLSGLEGKLLTYVEATYQDREQREAQKSIIRNLLWDWYQSLYEVREDVKIDYHITERKDEPRTSGEIHTTTTDGTSYDSSKETLIVS